MISSHTSPIRLTNIYVLCIFQRKILVSVANHPGLREFLLPAFRVTSSLARATTTQILVNLTRSTTRNTWLPLISQDNHYHNFRTVPRSMRYKPMITIQVSRCDKWTCKHRSHIYNHLPAAFLTSATCELYS